MKVTVEDKCSRCKHGTTKEIDSSEIPAFEEKEAHQVEALRALQEILQDPKFKHLPDLVVHFKGELTSTAKICDKCESTVRNHLGIIFKEMDPTKRAPRTRKKKSNGDVEKAQTPNVVAGEIVDKDPLGVNNPVSEV